MASSLQTSNMMLYSGRGLVAQRITRLTTDQKIAGSNPAEIDIFFLSILYAELNYKNKEKQTIIKTFRPRVGSNHQPFG